MNGADILVDIDAVVDIDIVVDIDNASGDSDVPDDAHFARWAAVTLAGLRTRAEIAVRLVDETESAALNAQYRHKDYATNVLSFPSELPEAAEPPLLGDLAICTAVVKREAREQGKSSEAHWAHMLVHGTLHLLGFDHIDDRDAEIMEQREIAVLARLGFANPYDEHFQDEKSEHGRSSQELSPHAR